MHRWRESFAEDAQMRDVLIPVRKVIDFIGEVLCRAVLYHLIQGEVFVSAREVILFVEEAFPQV